MVMQQPLHLRIAPNVLEAWYPASINAAAPPDGYATQYRILEDFC